MQEQLNELHKRLANMLNSEYEQIKIRVAILEIEVELLKQQQQKRGK